MHTSAHHLMIGSYFVGIVKILETKFRKLLIISDASRSEMLNSLKTLTEISARGLFIALPCSVREICRFLSSFSSRVRTT